MSQIHLICFRDHSKNLDNMLPGSARSPRRCGSAGVSLEHREVLVEFVCYETVDSSEIRGSPPGMEMRCRNSEHMGADSF